MSHEQNAGQNRSVKICSKPFESMAKLNILEQTLQISIAFMNKLRAG